MSGIGRVLRRWTRSSRTRERLREWKWPSFGKGESPSARPARKTSLFGKPAFGGPTETKKARSVVALSRDPPQRRGSPVRLRLPVFSTTVLRPLVRDCRRPTHDHRHVRFGQG